MAEHAGKAKRAVVITDGIFSMRGDHAPLDRVMQIARNNDGGYEENVVVVADDSHGVGAFGQTGRGTEEYSGGQVDILVATLGKALGVNGGYVVANQAVIGFLRESAPFYIYSNPITPGEARAATAALGILDSPLGRQLLDRLRALTRQFEDGLVKLGYEIIPGEHPVVPLMVRDTKKTKDLTAYLYESGVLATGLAYPVVPRGDEEIRFQINADHTEHDIDAVLGILELWPGR
jgi:glycine C-acetyltransferase